MKKYMVMDVYSGNYLKQISGENYTLAFKPEFLKGFSELAYFISYEYAEEVIKKIKGNHPEATFTIIEVFV